ncbi:MAG: hypothetical protein ACKVGZ_21090, partial [Alphaproteobacteria bacterium]
MQITDLVLLGLQGFTLGQQALDGFFALVQSRVQVVDGACVQVVDGVFPVQEIAVALGNPFFALVQSRVQV